MFSAYVSNPTHANFEGQDPDEKILLLLRAHPITNLSWIIPALLVFSIPFLISKVLPILGITTLVLPESTVISFLIINYLLVLVIVFEGFLYWYFNVTLITDEKVVDIDFASLLYKSVDLAPLSKIEEADSTVAGLLGTFFNFGNVSVQTAGAKVAIEMKNVPKPAIVADLVLDLAKRTSNTPGG